MKGMRKVNISEIKLLEEQGHPISLSQALYTNIMAIDS